MDGWTDAAQIDRRAEGEGTYGDYDACQELRAADDVDAPGEEALNDRGRDGAHDRDGEPRVVEGGQRGEAAISVDEVVEGDRGDEPRLHPFVYQDPVDWKDVQSVSGTVAPWMLATISVPRHFSARLSRGNQVW